MKMLEICLKLVGCKSKKGLSSSSSCYLEGERGAARGPKGGNLGRFGGFKGGIEGFLGGVEGGFFGGAGSPLVSVLAAR